MGRINLAVDDGLAHTLGEEARRQNKTLYAISNEAVETYLKISRLGKSSDEAVRIIQIFDVLEVMSSVPVPEMLLDKSLQIASKSSKKEIHAIWHQAGKTMGELLKGSAPTLEELVQFLRKNKELMPLDVFDVNLHEGSVEVLLAGAGYSEAAAECTLEALKGFLEAYGCSVQTSEFSGGFVKALALARAPAA